MRRWSLLAVVLAACATPPDVYLGSDLPRSAGTPGHDAAETHEPEPDASEPPPAADAEPPPRDPDPAAPDAAASTPDADASMTDATDASMPRAAASMPDAGLPTRLPSMCAPSTADCDGAAANGCEADLRRDRAHCGTCDSACQTEDCSCRDGKRVLQCAPGRADCDGRLDNGCEANLQTDLNNCGACARLCHTMGHDAMTATCNAGVCELTCQFHPYPQIDCDHDPDNGCETQAWTDTQNCGMCGRQCIRCELGTCMVI